MTRRIERWLTDFGNYIMRHGWSDPFGTSIPPIDATDPHHLDRVQLDRSVDRPDVYN